MRGRSLAKGARVAAPLAWLVVIALARGGVRAPERLLTPVALGFASLVQGVLRWTGVGALRDGAYVFVPGRFAYEVGIGCTGLLPAAVLVVAILASPGSQAAKWRGLSIGVPLLLVFNLVRLAHLFYLGIQAPRAFALAHSVWWEAGIVLMTFAVWMVWALWAARRDASRSSVSGWSWRDR